MGCGTPLSSCHPGEVLVSSKNAQHKATTSEVGCDEEENCGDIENVGDELMTFMF
jgi:hypothetical protein